MNRVLTCLFLLLVTGMTLVGFSPAYAITGLSMVPSHFGLKPSGNYFLYFSTLGPQIAVYQPQHKRELVVMMRDSLDRLRGARRPVLFDRYDKQTKQRTDQIWIVESESIEAPFLRWEKSADLESKKGQIVRTYWAALIVVPKGWSGRSLTTVEQDLFDRVVFEATPFLAVRPRELTHDGEWLTFLDYVEVWRSHLSFKDYEKYGKEINDETVSQVYQDLAQAEQEIYRRKYVEPQKAKLAEQIRKSVERKHMAKQKQMTCESIFGS